MRRATASLAANFLAVISIIISILSLAPAVLADSTVVFNEVMYHPREREAELEWIELHNQMAVDMDISGWYLAGGVFYTFAEGTVLAGGDYLVVAASPGALAAESGFTRALGPFSGRLDNSGELLELRNQNGRLMDQVDFETDGRWPVEPDGSGVSLAKLGVDLASEPAASWGPSAEVGGTPGARNFPESGGVEPLPGSEGLVSYWSFDEPSGAVFDRGGSGNNGTLGSAAARAPGLVGSGSVRLDNSADAFVNVGTGVAGTFAVTSGITLEALIVVDWSGVLDDHDMVFRKEDGQNRIVFGFQHDTSLAPRDVPLEPAEQPVLSFGLNTGGTYSELDMPLDGVQGRPSLAALRDARVHHLVATYDSTSGLKAIYVDGAIAFSAALPAGRGITSGGASSAYIGNMTGRSQPFSGVIDEVAFWDRALSAAEVAAHWANASQGEDYFHRDAASASGPPPLAFNEFSVSLGGVSWVEIVQHGEESLRLDGMVLASQGTVAAELQLPAQALPPGGYLVLTEAELGFELLPDARLFIYTPDRRAVAGGVRLLSGLYARHPEATGRWLTPDQPTPGAANSFRFRDEIVINEIFYHPRGFQAEPARLREELIFPIDAAWSFDTSGSQEGSAWREPGFDDSAWPRGNALFFNEPGNLPAPKNTEIPLGIIAFYFRTAFEWNGSVENLELKLRPVVDDGAVFYLNGTEIHRLNMPAGPVGPDTLAAIAVGDANFTGPFLLPPAALVQGRNVFAVELHQRTASSNDVAFGLELSTVTTLRPPLPYRESPEAWVELLNRSSTAVDLSGWRLAGGIDYAFEPGTVLAPAGFLVVAGDREFLVNLHPGLRVAGNFTGRLSRRSNVLRLEDDIGNPADELRYFDGGRWPTYADGGGSSLELRDPRADNSRAEAWAASDERGKARWQEVRYRGPASQRVGPTLWREFIIGLLDAGEVLIDDVSVVEMPELNTRQLIQNGGFDNGGQSWRFLGNHRQSFVEADPDNPSNPVLHLVATGPTEHMHNHVETTFPTAVAVVNGREYEISFRARWVAGSNQLNTRLYFNRLPRTTLLEVPAASGTPGAPNSRLEANIGPTFAALSHRPPVPAPGEEVEVTVRAEDPDGVASYTLWWSVNGAAFESSTMAAEAGGLFRGAIPGQAASRVVQFYVEAADGAGAIATFPARGRDSRALYKVNDGQAQLGTVHNLRIVLKPDEATFLHVDTNVMSNERVGATVIYDEREVFYDAGVRLKGSERGRPVAGRVGFNLRFDPEQPFRGVHEAVSIDRSGNWRLGGPFGQDEIMVKHIVNHAGGIPGMYDDLIRVIAPLNQHTGSALLLMAAYGDVFLDSQFPNGGDGTEFEFELIYYPTSTANGNPEGLKRPQPDEVIGTDNADLGDDKETYRWNFIIDNNRERDDYSGLIRFAKSFSLLPARLDAGTRESIDVDEWARTFAMYTLTGIGDTYTFGNNHNNIYYVRPEDGRVLVFPWDMDFAFTRGPSDSLLGDQNLRRVLQLPGNLHLFYYHLRDIISTTYNSTYLSRWAAHYGGLVGQNFSGIVTYVTQRRAFALAQLPPALPFAITTNGGADFTVDTPQVDVAGDAGVDVHTIIFATQGAQPQFAYSTVTRWNTTLPLARGANTLSFVALDHRGNVAGTDTIVVTSTFGEPEPSFIRGDVNRDGRLNATDAVSVLAYLFGGLALGCLDAADVDDNEALEITDAIRILEFLFRRGEPPAAPHPAPGADTDEGGVLGCEEGL